MEKEYTTGDWCRLIAFLINSDLKLLQYEIEYTEDEILHSNSHGELFGILSAIKFVNACIEEHKNKLLYEKILEGENINPSSDYISLIGLHCITMLWNAPDIERIIEIIRKNNNN